MAFSPKFVVSASVLILGLSGMACAAEDPQPSGNKQSQSSQQTSEFATIKGEIQKIEGDVYTIEEVEGGQVRLHLDQRALQGNSFKEGDKVQAKILKGDETYTVRSAKKAGQSSMHAQSPSGGMQSEQPTTSQSQKSQQDGTFTKTVRGEVKNIDGNVYYVQDSSGKEVRLRMDQSAEQEGDIQKGDTIEALVTMEKEYHVISAEPFGNQ